MVAVVQNKVRRVRQFAACRKQKADMPEQYIAVCGHIDSKEGVMEMCWVEGDRARKLVPWREVVKYRNFEGAKYRIIGELTWTWVEDPITKIKNRVQEPDERPAELVYGKLHIVLDYAARMILSIFDPVDVLPAHNLHREALLIRA